MAELLQGLLDQHILAGSHAALGIAAKLGEYIQQRVSRVVKLRSLEHHYTTLNKEFGGLNEVLWRLHEQGLPLHPVASLFDRPCLLGPLAAGQDTLAHMHANTQIPVIRGATARYEVTGDERFRRLAAFFVELLLRTRTFATGGSSIGEYWPPANRLGELVAPGEGTTQESCSTHNMMRLTRGLLLTAMSEAEVARHAEYHERALFNSVRAPVSNPF